MRELLNYLVGALVLTGSGYVCGRVAVDAAMRHWGRR